MAQHAPPAMVDTTSPSPRDDSTFLFTIGPSARKYPLPSSLLAPFSPTFAAFATPCTYLPDCDTATFDRFVAFLHAGDFPSPLFVRIPTSKKPQRYTRHFLPPAPFHQSPALCGAFAAFASSKQYAFPRRYRHGHRRGLLYHNKWRRRRVDDTHAFALCAVARVYLLAARYGVEALMRLCLHKLHRLVVCVREIWDGVPFLRLCVGKEATGPLYKLAFIYCLFHYADLERRPEFAAFVADAPDFALAVMDELAEHKAADAGGVVS